MGYLHYSGMFFTVVRIRGLLERQLFQDNVINNVMANLNTPYSLIETLSAELWVAQRQDLASMHKALGFILNITRLCVVFMVGYCSGGCFSSF